jgi:hypothetical protein
MEDLTKGTSGMTSGRIGYAHGMLIGAIIVFCVLLFVVALLAPRLSRYLERGGDKPLSVGQRTAGKAPGPLGSLLQKPFGKSRKAVHKSGSAGRRAHSKLPD